MRCNGEKMDYVRSHHLWRPLAAMSGKEQEPAVIAAPPENFSLKSTIFHNIITIASSTEESNDVWYPLDGNETSNFLLKNNFSSNFSVNRTFNYYPHDETIKIVTMVGIAVLLGFIILATVIGNVFVIAAILLERNLQNVANYLILSLAVADLLVACLVMPLGAVYEVSQEWTLGPELCDMWTSSDVLCCTASILHLVAIALDRYWAVTNIDYIHQRTSKRIGMMIFIIWFVSFLVCIAPLLGWKDPKWDDRIRDKECLISQDLYYQIFATASSFYLPLLVILILYWRIFQTARKRIRRRQVIGSGANTSSQNPAAGGIAGGLAAASGTGGIAAAVVTIIGRPLPTISETTTAFTTVSSNSSPEKTSFANGLEPDMPTTTDCSMSYQPQHYPVKKKSRDSADSKRERKAAKTLAIITGAFVLCWLPFFIMAVLLPINANLFEKYVISIFLWLGYFNSTLNPIIYTIFSPEFRHAFKKILCGRNYARRNKHFGIRHFQ
ncbi:5-hydroxytryptamine receptor 2A-like Protein [Tribolium castaneum]|uniref:5-hydroxytryptamine receptor 2A-like Protein n=1 Tax=Tribolium castaneum TaxID=7070 RepID=A0A139WC03_TRICA|nr:5-hydroxytryptamine receptor 2A-like Protein [Tribolium castaneum]